MLNHIFLSAFSFPLLLATSFDRKGGSDVAAGVNDLNDIASGFACAVGAVLIAVAILKYIMSIAEESPQAKMNATMLMGGGVFFISMGTILEILKVTSSSTATGISYKIIGIITSLVTYAGGGLLALGIFMYVLAIAQENPDQQNKATTILGVATGLISFKALDPALRKFIYSSTANTTTLMETALSTISAIATYIGGGILVLAILRLVMSIREENSQDQHKAGIQFAVAISLLGFSGVLKIFGLSW